MNHPTMWAVIPTACQGKRNRCPFDLLVRWNISDLQYLLSLHQSRDPKGVPEHISR